MEVNLDPNLADPVKRTDSPVSADSEIIKHRLKMKLTSKEKLAVTVFTPPPADVSATSTDAAVHQHHHGREDDLWQTAEHSEKRMTSASPAQDQHHDQTSMSFSDSPYTPSNAQAGYVPDIHPEGVNKAESTNTSSSQPQHAFSEDHGEVCQLNVYFEDMSKKKQDHQEEDSEMAPALDRSLDKDVAGCEQEVKTEPDALHDACISLNTPQPAQASVRDSAMHDRVSEDAQARQKNVSPRVAALSSLPFTVVTSAGALSSLVQSCASSGSALPNLLCNVPVSSTSGSLSSPSLSLLCSGADTAVSQTQETAGQVSTSLPQSVGKSCGLPSLDAFSQPQMFLANTSSLPDLSQLLAERFAQLLSSVSEAVNQNSAASCNMLHPVDTGQATPPPLPPTSADSGSHCPGLVRTPITCQSSVAPVPWTSNIIYATSASSVESDGTPAISVSSTDTCHSTSSSSPIVTSVGKASLFQPRIPLDSNTAVPCPQQLVVYNVTPLLVLPQTLFNNILSSSSPTAEDGGEEDVGENFTTTATDKLPAMPCNKCGQMFETFQALRKHMKSHIGRPHKCDECGKSFAAACHLRKHKMNHAKDKKFDCAVCQKSFTSRGVLEEHMQNHPDEKPHVCEVCNKGFHSSSLLSKHKKEHASSKHACKVCNMTFKLGTELKEHKKTHASPNSAASKEVLCAQCGKKFNNARGLSHHICKEKRQPYDSRTCKTCKKMFPSRISLQIHVHSTHMDSSESFNLHKNFFSEQKQSAKRVKKAAPNPERFVCPVCGKVLKSLSTLQVHERIHRRPFVCKTCNKGFSHYYQLKRHQHVHTGIKDFTCEICEKKFITSQNLKLHYIGIHLGDKPFVCQVCNQGFVTRHSLNLHQLTHSDKKPFTCDICGRSFKYESVLKNHRLLHLGDRPFKCDICDKAYVCANYLKKHKRRVHSDPKYTCDVCGKACYFANELKNHKLTHTEDRPYSCEVCSKAFHTVVRLKNHKRIHAEEKPYSCSLCEKVFASTGMLNSHNRRVHCGKSFVCEVCQKAFKHYDSLKDHMNVHLQLKNFVCEECGKDFYSNNALNTHKKLKHMELKRDFVCNVCGKSFPFLSYLKEHEKIHTKEKTLVCELCNKAVKYKLSRHMKRVHNYVKP